ncbi:single-stranded DNA-binding protein [Streptomyces chitinivorans]|uniref:Single-stranded DNA-binding protein n=1 Tax=Streptomyces chitinivorans TaxID=1257027 RepID=A0ABW7HW29_9ACTN|nr:single-stranded DNA-binding protein [Streptomyces chitinivorans]MDH2407653.1 single-stranded DNA-binding protein [Streptomyces chitinivorans]
MNETTVTVVGNAASAVEARTTASGHPVARLRLATTVRRYDEQRGGWTDAYTSFYTVWAFRGLAENLAASVVVGEPLVVQGRLRVQQGERDGKRWTSAEIEATAVGHDLARGTSSFRRVVRAVPTGEPAASP